MHLPTVSRRGSGQPPSRVQLSPSENKVIVCLKKKEVERASEEEAKDVGRQERATERDKKRLEGDELWRLARL